MPRRIDEWTRSSAHVEGTELVAIRIPEVAGIESAAARAGRAFVFATERHCLVVNLVDFRGALGVERDHDAVTDGGRAAIGGLDHEEHGRLWVSAPGDEFLRLHGALRADDAQQIVVVASSAGNIV